MHDILSGACIKGIGACTSKTVIDSTTIQFDSLSTSNTFINKIGIKQKHVSGGKYTTADLCERAVIEIMKSLNWEPSSIDLLVSVTQSPDFIVPGNSYILQSRLNLPNSCMLVDINAGCTGWIQGLLQCISLINTYQFKKVLLLCGETNILSHETEGNSHNLMGDMGTATAISLCPEHKTYYYDIMNMGSRYNILYAPDSGANSYFQKKDDNAKVFYDHTIKMDGIQLQTFISGEVVPAVDSFIKGVPYNMDHYFIHQPNKLHFDYLIKKIGLDSIKAPSIISRFGNVSSACIPLTIHQSFQLNNNVSQQVSCHAFGVGLSIANIAFELPPIVCPKIVEL